jgi:hypothetical protein
LHRRTSKIFSALNTGLPQTRAGKAQRDLQQVEQAEVVVAKHDRMRHRYSVSTAFSGVGVLR